MKFNQIDSSLTHQQVKQATARLRRLAVELGVRKNNEHIGSGLGGNNFQLLVLIDLPQELSASKKETISFHKERIVWGEKWLFESTFHNIRHTLDKTFDSIPEGYKYKALALESLVQSSHLRWTLAEHKDQFPKLNACLDGKGFAFDPGLDSLDKLILAYVMCQELASELDVGDYSSVHPIGAALVEFPAEIILLSVRRYIQIERLVEHNLDEDVVFSKVCRKVTKHVD